MMAGCESEKVVVVHAGCVNNNLVTHIESFHSLSAWEPYNESLSTYQTLDTRFLLKLAPRYREHGLHLTPADSTDENTIVST